MAEESAWDRENAAIHAEVERRLDEWAQAAVRASEAGSRVRKAILRHKADRLWLRALRTGRDWRRL